VIGGFYIGEYYCILHALGNKIENLAVFNLMEFCNLPNRQNKLYNKFSSYMVIIIKIICNYGKIGTFYNLLKIEKTIVYAINYRMAQNFYQEIFDEWASGKF